MMSGERKDRRDILLSVPTRRTFLELVTLGGGGGFTLIGCGDNIRVEDDEREPWTDGRAREERGSAPRPAPVHGASFEVSPTGALLWLEAETELKASALLEVTDGAELDRVELADPIRRIWIIELTGLMPARRYWFRVALEGRGESGWHRFVTAPEPQVAAPVHFCYSADFGVGYSLDLTDRIREREPDFYLNLGDWPYQDRAPASHMLEEFLAKHRAARQPRQIRALLRDVPLHAIYDDHDIIDNWDGRVAIEHPERLAAGLEAWDLYFPLRQPERYRRIRRGALAEIFVLDTRMYRSPNDEPDGPDKTMLGAEQRAWLEEGLATSDAAFKIIASSVPFDFATERDHWSAFATERDAILSFIAMNEITGVVAISTDRHYFEARHYRNGLKEFHIGPLSAGAGRYAALNDEIVARSKERNVGEIMVEPGDPPLLTFRCLNEAGAVLYEESFAPGRLAIKEV
jgi:alkaline phosphatase D